MEKQSLTSQKEQLEENIKKMRAEEEQLTIAYKNEQKRVE